MRIKITQSELDTILTEYLESKGLTLEGNYVEMSFNKLPKKDLPFNYYDCKSDFELEIWIGE